jgi:hypothetical protein
LETEYKKSNPMKKLSILLSLVFFAFVISASAQTSSATAGKEKATIEKSNDGTKSKAGCCAYSSKSCKAGSAKCCASKSEAKKSGASAKTEAVVNEQKATAVTGSK